jgi:hypothetical protein
VQETGQVVLGVADGHRYTCSYRKKREMLEF